MKHAVGLLIFIAALCCATLVFAQTPVDPSGHWEGSITAPFGEVQIEVDITRDATPGRLKAASTPEFTGTFNQPVEHVKGLPLRSVTIDGRAIAFELKAGSGGGTFQGIVFADGRSIGGEFTSPLGTAPFALTRTGDAIVDAPLTSPAIGKELEGRWTGTLDAGGRQLRLEVTLANQPDGQSIGRAVSLDEGGLELPIGIRQAGRAVTLDLRMTGATYSATLNAEGTELTGTFAQGSASLPLVFRRVGPSEDGPYGGDNR